jgi:hypothetical protein
MHKGIFYRGLLLSILIGLVSLMGCGGGGSSPGPSGNATVSGRVLRAETNTRPDPAATITIGGVTGTSNPNDGTFTLTGVPASTTTGTITAQGASNLTLTLALQANQTTQLGDVFISDTGYNATLTGRIVTLANNQQTGVTGATVTIAGKTVTSGQNGAFTIAGLPVGLGSVSGVYGKVTAQGLEPKDITAETLEFPLEAGNNPLQNPIVLLPPSGSVPLPPFTIAGKITINGAAAGTGLAPITLTNTANSVTVTTRTDDTGQYSFWVVPGTYTVSATAAGKTQQTTVTLTRLDTPVTAPTINFVP